MIKHVVLLTWKDSTSQDQIDAVTSAFRALGDEIAEVVSYSFGEDVGIYRGNADYALIAEFQNEADLKAYVVHPSHQELLSNITGPILDSFLSVQFGAAE
ncbi:Dabb family protein [Zhongshania borealis]|uniref:Dabb family protein n=1 Tax=Zhongshania borealis TaxID=889488 RepID=A0ABP7X0D0_9GAMM